MKLRAIGQTAVLDYLHNIHSALHNIYKKHIPEADQVGVEERGKEEGENQFPDLSTPLHVTPPDLREQGLQKGAAPLP